MWRPSTGKVSRNSLAREEAAAFTSRARIPRTPHQESARSSADECAHRDSARSLADEHDSDSSDHPARPVDQAELLTTPTSAPRPSPQPTSLPGVPLPLTSIWRTLRGTMSKTPLPQKNPFGRTGEPPPLTPMPGVFNSSAQETRLPARQPEHH